MLLSRWNWPDLGCEITCTTSLSQGKSMGNIMTRNETKTTRVALFVRGLVKPGDVGCDNSRYSAVLLTPGLPKGGAIFRASAFYLCDRGFDSRCGPTTFMWKEYTSIRYSTESRGVFFAYPGFLSQGMLTVWVQLGLAPNWPFHRSCASWSNMSHNVAVRSTLRKPSTRSGWLASFAIQLNSHAAPTKND
jgi:hypothetical protein